MKDRKFDIIVVGGGMVGAAIACGFAKRSFKVALLEPHPPSEKIAHTECCDLRVSAISLASQKLLDRLGAWQHIDKIRISPYHKMHIWDYANDGYVDFDAADVREPVLGHIVENEVIRYGLFTEINNRKNIEVLTESDISWLDLSPDVARIGLRDDKVLEAALIVAADGANSNIRELSGIETSVRDTGHYGVVTQIQTENPHQNTAWQKFLSTGPLAFLPLSDGNCSIVWSINKKRALMLTAADKAKFLQLINRAVTDAPFGKVIDIVSKVSSFPLIERHAATYISYHMALAGDAAHTIHPLAGQGVNIGFADANSLLRIISSSRRNVANIELLKKYEKARRLDNTMMQQSMRGFQNAFSIKNDFLSYARGFGMALFNNSNWLKRRMIKKATEGK